MSLADELRDPWTYVVAGLAGGFAFAFQVEPAAAALVGTAVMGAKVFSGLFTNRGKRRAEKRRQRRLPVLTRTPEAAWLGRAEQAQWAFQEISQSGRQGPIAEQVASFGRETGESLGALERLAGQASAIRSAMARLDLKRLAWERDRLLAAAGPDDDPRVIAERERSLNSVQAQLDTYHRLDRTLAMLIARLESGTLAIEGLVARLAEVVALAETSTTAVDGMSQLDDLAHELEGLRAGLVEAETVSTMAMQGLPPLPAPGTGSVATTAQEQKPVRRRAGGE